MVAVTGSAQTVTQVSNAASEALAATTGASALPNSSIAQGSYFSIYGSGFGPSTSTCGANFSNCFWDASGALPFPSASNPLPTTVQGTSVAVTVGGTTVQAYIEFAAAINSTYSQINAIMPSNTPTGSGTLVVTTNGTSTPAYPVTVVGSSFGTFSINEAGTGAGIITNTGYTILTPFTSAKPGDYVILWGTGLGAAPDASTEATAAPGVNNFCPGSNCPTVWIAGQKANIYYAGRSSYTAEDQIIFQIPASGAQGCYVQVALQTGSVVGNFTSIPVDPSGATCSDADGINYADIAALNKSSVNLGAISMLSNYLTLNLTTSGLGISALGQRHRFGRDRDVQQQRTDCLPGVDAGAIGEQLLGKPVREVSAAERSGVWRS